MTVALRQLRVYVRGGLLLVVAVAVAMVFFRNRSHSVTIWFFGLTDDQKPVNVVWLMLCTAVATLVVWWTVSLAWGLLRDMREVKRLRAVDTANRVIEERAAALNDRERRIDAKLRRAIGETGETTGSKDSEEIDLQGEAK